MGVHTWDDSASTRLRCRLRVQHETVPHWNLLRDAMVLEPVVRCNGSEARVIGRACPALVHSWSAEAQGCGALGSCCYMQQYLNMFQYASGTAALRRAQQ